MSAWGKPKPNTLPTTVRGNPGWVKTDCNKVPGHPTLLKQPPPPPPPLKIPLALLIITVHQTVYAV